MNKTVYISIGNSDDKLTQPEWSSFHWRVDNLVRMSIQDDRPIIHGAWVSESSSRWQNACWCVELSPTLEKRLRFNLPLVAAEYGQDSIAWAEATTELITPKETADGRA